METEEHHMIFIPGPGMGHIVAAVEVSKLLLIRDPHLSITFLLINDPQIQNYMQSLHTQPNPNLEFLDLPKAQTPNNSTAQLDSKSPPVIAFEKIQRHKPQVKDAVHTIVKSKSNVIGFIVDMFCAPMIDVAKEFNIPTYTFFTSSATFLSLKLHVQTLYDEHGINVSEFKNSDKEFYIPGFLNHVPAKVLPSTMLDNINGGLETVLTTARKVKETKGVLVNTFQELELTAIESLSNRVDKIPPVYPIGPIVNLNNESNNDDYEIVSWLDKQPVSSVVFLCFGSQGSFSEAQIKQLAVALERTGHRFLWSLKRRPPNEMIDDEIVVSSEEIEKGIRKLMEKDLSGIREKVKGMKENGERALLDGGSSDKFLGCLIHDILKNSST
ncbi:hypothetical protein ACJIZ3_010918 [Penstemon smallii]|uniref:Uncharacterized protein n=1 Tax=Penstemon smallii TaxID=265156 RepID=A0ABD3UHM8_9LAMI